MLDWEWRCPGWQRLENCELWHKLLNWLGLSTMVEKAGWFKEEWWEAPCYREWGASADSTCHLTMYAACQGFKSRKRLLLGPVAWTSDCDTHLFSKWTPQIQPGLTRKHRKHGDVAQSMMAKALWLRAISFFLLVMREGWSNGWLQHKEPKR